MCLLARISLVRLARLPGPKPFWISQPHAQWRADDFPGVFVSAIGILQQLARLARFKEYILVMSEVVGLKRPTE
jgi:hypothetical protein